MKKCFAALLALLLVCAPALAFGPAGETIEGIDVSVYNGTVDFDSVARSGIRMVYIRASLGFSYVDPTAERNADGAREAGLEYGFYHFCTASSVEEAQKQAEFFAQNIRRYSYDLKPVMELSPTRTLNRDQTVQVALAFLTALERLTGHLPAIYCSASTARDQYDERLGGYSLWVAQYGASQPESNDTWSVWAGWQYSERGRVDGVSGDVDRDLFTAQMRVQTSPTPTAAPTSAPTATPVPTAMPTDVPTCLPTATPAPTSGASLLPGAYVVQPGDTLSAIALKFGVSVEALAARNGLENPSLIYVGQILYYR